MVKQELRKVLVILPKKDIEGIESEIAEGRYVTKSDCFRLAVKRLLYSDERISNFERLRAELQRDLKKKRISKSKIQEDLNEAKKETAQQVAELLG
jgi:Arc/MetJ-type ribon-helix-helix transcriptional regulator